MALGEETLLSAAVLPTAMEWRQGIVVRFVCLSVIFLFAIWLDGHRFMSGSPTFVQMMTSRHLGVAVTLDLKVIGQGRWDRKWVGMGFAVRVPD